MGAGASTSVQENHGEEINALKKRLADLEKKASEPAAKAAAAPAAARQMSAPNGQQGQQIEHSSSRLGLTMKGKDVDYELVARDWAELPKYDTAFEAGNADGKPWKTIDCHLHLMDFLQKSEGTFSMAKAMNEANVSKAIVFGMPCCKKWEQQEPSAPLYYQDDNSDCYVYHYADQMVADAWLACPDHVRERFAPCFASFNPTDKFAIQHVERMWNKYPGMWRSIGEVMCRHDDLTTMLQDKETPTANHPGLKPVYEFCAEKDVPIIVHHNSTQMLEEDGTWEYLWEIEEVVDQFPQLKFVWAHCGVSRRVSEPNHHKMCDMMLRKHPNMYLDMSWVVWEDVICDKQGNPKSEWLQVIERHQDRCMIGSDQVGQFEGLLHKEITKYYKLFNQLSDTAARKVAYDNCEELFFGKTLSSPALKDVVSKYPTMPSCMNAERLMHKEGKFMKIGYY
mmetsp:Transcript_7060/g.8113  ORF Transcript_7060/g.8113 Transcript_7060/m.8113 type:complete len:452 (+) Transcript_7060:84-1439(+)|eukprot:CAMPEP_0197849080 /NCGR_PEP_ID=MMETSP1438-20131217/10823_1 /TAXON_ID=1461541 /ORGANISM="Pterosperma sp., Strain CCMP1384" /LENGTH=451 /DNA_ID=CAMNT_0043461603 /DNA_START=76 /DNA_END=1431 /DNA_ORIENTATION=+